MEFQRNHRLVVRVHKEALYAMRNFWQNLMRSKVGSNELKYIIPYYITLLLYCRAWPIRLNLMHSKAGLHAAAGAITGRRMTPFVTDP